MLLQEMSFFDLPALSSANFTYRLRAIFPHILLARCLATVTSSLLISTCRTRQDVEMENRKTRGRKHARSSGSVLQPLPEIVRQIHRQFCVEDAWIDTALRRWEEAAPASDVLNVQPASGTRQDFALTHFDTCGGVEPFVVRLHVMWLHSLLVCHVVAELCCVSAMAESNWLFLLCLARFWSVAICGRLREKTFVTKEVIWFLESLSTRRHNGECKDEKC